jgi:pyrroline-5-carboxylate reductase
MFSQQVGFIGGGRITQIFLNALVRKNLLPPSVIVNEPDKAVAEKLKLKFKNIAIENEVSAVLSQKYIFISLHPPVFMETLVKILPYLQNEPVIISLAPKITIKQMSTALDGYDKIIRMIPNAPSIINSGFNPVTYSNGITNEEKIVMSELFSVWGEFPEVAENKLEAYAITTAMGPTYFWFQFNELKKLACQFGLTDVEYKTALAAMINGSIDTINSEIDFNDVNDLVPVKPLSNYEENIRGYYQDALPQIFNKIKPVI